MKTMIQQAVPATLAFAKSLFTRGTDAFGAEEIARIFGGMPINGHLNPLPMPFSEAELIRARELDQYLILQSDKTADGQMITMERLYVDFKNKLGNGKLLRDIDLYKKEKFYTDDVPAAGWKLVSRKVIPGSVREDYVGETEAISNYLVNKVYKDEELPDEYKSAVDEFASRKAELEALCGNNWKIAREELAGLKLNQLFREKPVEVLYGLVVQHEINHECLLENMYIRTSQRYSGGELVTIGRCDFAGVSVISGYPDGSYSDRGVRFSRSAVRNLES